MSEEMGADHGLVLSFFLSRSTFFSRSLEASEGILGWNALEYWKVVKSLL